MEILHTTTIFTKTLSKKLTFTIYRGWKSMSKVSFYYGSEECEKKSVNIIQD